MMVTDVVVLGMRAMQKCSRATATNVVSTPFMMVMMAQKTVHYKFNLITQHAVLALAAPEHYWRVHIRSRRHHSNVVYFCFINLRSGIWSGVLTVVAGIRLCCYNNYCRCCCSDIISGPLTLIKRLSKDKHWHCLCLFVAVCVCVVFFWSCCFLKVNKR